MEIKINIFLVGSIFSGRAGMLTNYFYLALLSLLHPSVPAYHIIRKYHIGIRKNVFLSNNNCKMHKILRKCRKTDFMEKKIHLIPKA